MANSDLDPRDEFGEMVVDTKAGRPTQAPEIRDGIAHRLRLLWKGLELKEVATRLGYDSTPDRLKRLQRYVAPTNPSTPDLSVLIGISTTFDVALDYLVFGQERRLPIDQASTDALEKAAKTMVVDELRRRYDYDASVIEEILPDSILDWAIVNLGSRIAGFRAGLIDIEPRRVRPLFIIESLSAAGPSGLGKMRLAGVSRRAPGYGRVASAMFRVPKRCRERSRRNWLGSPRIEER